MFGQDDNNQQTDQQVAPLVDTGALNAALPDPIAPSGFNIPTQAPVDTGSIAGLGAPTLPSTPTPNTATATDSPAPASSDDLVTLKQQALQHLSPLVGHLNQTPEEKFRTTMMMIQASDNKDLVKDAFEAAQGITDDKARAQALLDVINEINYFTQHEN